MRAVEYRMHDASPICHIYSSSYFTHEIQELAIAFILLMMIVNITAKNQMMPGRKNNTQFQ